MTQAYLTQQDVNDYGADLINLTQRAALQSVAPHIQNLEAQNQELQRQLAREARARLDDAVERAIPNYCEIDQNPRWLQWLTGTDVLSGRRRQDWLNDAIAHGDASRVVSFFRQFMQQEGGSGAHSSSPSYGAARRPRPADGPVYSGQQIAKLYEAKRRGAYDGRQAEWDRLEADFYRAQREGRVVGGTNPNGGK